MFHTGFIIPYKVLILIYMLSTMMEEVSHQLHQLSSTQMDLPALSSTHDPLLIGHILQAAFLLL